ncbi:hypothetical protein VTO42DRAFT_6858 [Malbranchea cinnamomea]
MRILVVGWIYQYVAGKAVYNVYFHPLSKFPGPKYLALTRIPVTLATFRGQRAQFRHNLHRRYGEIVRVAPNELSFAHAQSWRDIYSTQAKVTGTRAIRGVQEETGAHSVVTASGDDHTRQKRMMTTLFSEKVLKENQPTFVHYADLLVQRLAESEGKPMAMADWYNFTTFDIIGDLLFGESLGLLDNSKYIPWVTSISDFLKAFAMIVVLYEFRLFRFFWSLMPNKMLRSLRETHFRYTSEKLERYLQKSDKERRGIFKMLLDGGSHRGLHMEELYPNAPILMFGGSETAATTLRCLTFLLLKNPDKMQKLVNEIRGAFSSSDQMNYDSLAQLKYLNACIEESLRFYTPCTNGLPRLVQPGGAVICGEWVPGGTNVSVAMYALHRSARYFHLPDSFVPERWLEDAEKLDPLFANDNKSVVRPFMYGPHDCPGKK